MTGSQTERNWIPRYGRETDYEQHSRPRQHADHTTPSSATPGVAALSSEIDRTLLARTLLETRVVLFRKRDGSVSALHDRCPHRSFPLSKSKLEDDTIVCGYHGITYDGSGRCLHVPSAPNGAMNISVRNFPRSRKGPAGLDLDGRC